VSKVIEEEVLKEQEFVMALSDDECLQQFNLRYNINTKITTILCSCRIFCSSVSKCEFILTRICLIWSWKICRCCRISDRLCCLFSVMLITKWHYCCQRVCIRPTKLPRKQGHWGRGTEGAGVRNGFIWWWMSTTI
jgi:hypothetical protein